VHVEPAQVTIDVARERARIARRDGVDPRARRYRTNTQAADVLRLHAVPE
jgi:hypothetical protein